MQPNDPAALRRVDESQTTRHNPPWLAWFGELVSVHGPGEYVLRIRLDGSVTVKRPRKPLEFDYRGDP